MYILKELDNLINESYDKDVVEEIDPQYSTSEQGKLAAAQQIKDRIFRKDDETGTGGKSELSKDDNPLSALDKKEGSKSGEIDKTFKSTKMDDIDDLDTLDGDDIEDTDDKREDTDPFEFDDFDYDDSPHSGSGEDEKGEGDVGMSDETEDGEFDDSELGDEDDYDFGDEDEHSSSSDSSSKSGMKSESTSDDSDMEGDDDIDYDDTLDYDSKKFDSIEDEVEDALDRIKEGASTKMEKESIDKMKKDFTDKEDGESSKEKADDLSKSIDDATTDKSNGSGELAGESLDKTPDDKTFEEEMEKSGFDKKDINDMKKSKDTNNSDKIDDEKIAQDAMEELDKRAKSKGEPSGSSLSRTIMRSILKGEISNMEWKEIATTFLKSKSTISGTVSRTRTTRMDKKHSWRDVVLPTPKFTHGGVDEINCFIDFSGSVSQPLVFSFLQRVLALCDKLSFKSVNVYGFAYELSKPFIIKQNDIPKDETKIEEYLKEMWKFIYSQDLNGSIENFEDVSKEILKLKQKDFNCPIFIFGDGLWAVSYPNPKPPKYLKEMCSRYLKDILVLIYYDDSNEYIKSVLESEIAYLRDIVGLKHVVTTKIDKLD